MLTRLKIGLVCPYSIYRGGGVQECIIALQNELTKRGHQVFIITPQPRDGKGEVPPNTLFVGSGTQLKSMHTTTDFSVSASQEALKNILDHHIFDILHFHEPWVPMLSRQIMVKSSAVNVGTFHARLPDTMMSKTLEKAITPYTRSVLKYLSGMTAVSDVAAEYVRSLTDEVVQIIPNGIDLKKYKLSKMPRTKQTILYIGRLEKRKGVKYLLKAFKKLSISMPGASLIIVGDGAERKKLEEQAKGMKNVKFLGQIDEQTKLHLLQTCSLFCSPALYGESFGIVLLEAMATGIPIVAGNNPGYSTVLQGRGKVSLVNPKDNDEFARSLGLFMTDNELIKQWSEWAKEYVKQFDYIKVVNGYEALYKKLLADKS